MLHPARHALRCKRVQCHGGRCPDKIVIGLLARCDDEHKQCGRIGRCQVPHHLVAQLGLALAELFHAANHHGAPLGQHRWCIHQGVKRFGRQIGGEPNVEIEVPAGPHGPVHKGADRLVLENIFVTVQQIDEFGEGSALL